jgi:hypothetical protein
MTITIKGTEGHNAVCFYNDGEFDKRSFTMLGLSAKEGEDKIGFFGTGFKYAIATLLRHGLKVCIETPSTVYNFHTAESTFRDKEYTSIYCAYGSEYIELPFTTHLGANWKLWQAYRELYTNAKDEGGGVCLGHFAGGAIAGDVCVYVGGDDINDFAGVYHKHDKYFLDQLTVAEGKRMRCVSKKQDSDNVVYYKTMYTGTKLEKETYFTYDYKATQDLTEDRTLSDTWYIRTHIGELWIHDMPYELLVKHLPEISTDKYFEHNLEVGYNPPSKDFIRACTYLNEHNRPMPMWARELLTKSLPFEQQVQNYTPTRHEMVRLKKAIAVLHHHKCMVDMNALILCGDLPNEVAGYYCDGVIYISRKAFASLEMLLGTIYEEHVHMVECCGDFTRKMQNVLVDRVASLMVELYEIDND